MPQRKFFDWHVKKFIDKKKKVYVIISDAMRFEIGEELSRMIGQENRFEAEVKHMVTGLPSYTQLGMASLLPNDSLVVNSDKSATVNVDGQSSSGIVNRRKILDNGTEASIRTTAITSETLLGFNKDQARDLVREHNVVYIYHDVIDDRGDDRDTETQVFAATEEALEDLTKMVTKLTSANATNLLITADHGFIYQEDIEESEFSTSDVGGDEVTKNNRRFKLGKGLTKSRRCQSLRTS